MRRKIILNSAGFSLTEVAICVVIIGLILTILFVKAGNLTRQVSEGQARANLGILRLAIMTYYGTNGGVWPANPLSTSLVHSYIDEVPYLNLKHHSRTNGVTGPELTDSGGWCYNPDSGEIRIDCTHLALDGTQFSEW